MPTVSSSRAFTLFELLLVVVLISIMYGIFVHKLTRPPQSDTDKLTLLTLKEFLGTFPFKRKAEAICLEPCSECHLYFDGKQADDEGFKLFKSHPNVYRPDRFGQLRTIDFLPMMDAQETLQNVCFVYTLYANGSGSHYAVEDDKNYYLFDPYMYPTHMTKSFSEVTEFFDNSKKLPNDESDFNR